MLVFDKYELKNLGFKFDRDLGVMQITLRNGVVVGTLSCESRISGMKMISFQASKGNLINYLNEKAKEIKQVA